MKRIAIGTIILLLLVLIAYGANTSSPWDGTTWDVAAPDIGQPIGNHYKEIYDLRKGTAVRLNKEHETLATSSAGGVHKQGTARMWYLATASIPNFQPDGATALDSGDNGMLWHDITTDIIYTLDDYSDPTVGNGWISTGMFLGNVDVGASKFTVAVATGNTVIAGTLGVTGASTFTAEITANGGVTLGAGDDLIGSSTSDITINTNKFTVAGATGNTVVAGTLGVTGVATIADASTLASSAAPTADAEIANKKYVDDQKATLDQRAKAWANFNGRGSNGACTVNNHFNVTGVARTDTGDYTITWATDFGDAHYVVVYSSHKNGSSSFIHGDGAKAAGADQTTEVAYITCVNQSGTAIDPDRVRFIAYGDQ